MTPTQEALWEIDQMRTFVLTFAFIAATAGCSSSSPTAPENGSFAIEPIVQVSVSGYDAPVRATLRSPGEWAVAWDKLHAGLQPVPPRPPVDFGRHVVVLAAAGTRPNSCHSIEITRVRSSIEGQPVFDVRETRPGSDCVCLQVVTQPAHAVLMTAFAGQEEYLEQAAELAC